MHRRTDADGQLCAAIEAGVYARHLLAEGCPRRPRTDLERVAAAGARAMEELIQRHLGLALRVAAAQPSPRLPLADRVQEAAAALVRAAEKFDHRRGNRFATYAVWWLRQAVQRAEADQADLIRIPIHVDAAYRRVASLFSAQGEGWHGFVRANSPALEEEGAHPDMVRWLAELRTPVGLEYCAQEAADDGCSVTGPVEARALCRHLLGGVRFHDPLAAEVLRRRFGFTGEPQSLDQIAGSLGLTRQRVRQLEKEAIGQLRTFAGDEGAPRDA
ncbi:sigma-70 family RNA polymerase sigma factor [Tessaracoccus lubricantis]|uniref:Sigma-70 family RNA polymerase sigma factor n=1 Tax=Tessaracoccus lubricantis TaxID=545543 RepID=A0ABP9F0Y3_9ACTN